jgi:CheY-like chemotaxis protein
MSRRILIVEDSPTLAEQLRLTLQAHGYEVTVATDGAEALEKAWRDPPDMIITDILMPVMDGFTLCREWEKDEVLKAIPFVFYTATYTDPKDEEFALSLGAERFIVKPADPDVFAEILQQVLENREAGRLAAPCEPVEEEEVYLKQYNEALIRKLEDKMLQLEETNWALEQDIIERKRAEARVEHLNLVLRAIRSVNQLIIKVKDRNRLIQGVCDRLIETRSYYNAWIALIDESDKPVATAEAGLGESFLPLVERLERGEPFHCGRMALAQADVLIIETVRCRGGIMVEGGWLFGWSTAGRYTACW